MLWDALYDGLLGEQRLVAIDHHIEVGSNLRRHLVEALCCRIVFAGRHDYLGAERLGLLLDLLTVSSDIHLTKLFHLLTVFVNPLDHGLTQDEGQRLFKKT